LLEALEFDSNITIQVYLTFSFTRPEPDTAYTTTGTYSRTLSPSNSSDLEIITEFYNASSLPCTTTPLATSNIVLDGFFTSEIRLTEDSKISSLGDFSASNLDLSYSCENYWALNVNDTGIVFTAFSDLISTSFFSTTSIMGFYLTVTFVVGTYMRALCIYKGDRTFIVDSPNPDALINLLDCIHMMRLEKNIRREEEYYHIFLEVLRSPELMKHICGSSLREPL